ncbi:hypothetical protein BGAL_0153g00060 [Botrytis galanthina]|uniref:Uncharacterized protein n=1 Tax=Botrytis galanthina TaxID=278940 RepID=A0A4S8R0C9_9HELO|nr:hypothetical protein BGAL_0153g00060 [Botrytis galanthina]
MKIRILSRELVREGAPAIEINGTLIPNYHGNVVLHKLCSSPELWKWNLKPEKVDNIKDFDIDVSGDYAWPSYFRFGGDKKGWHLVRNLHAMHSINMSELVQRLTKGEERESGEEEVGDGEIGGDIGGAKLNKSSDNTAITVSALLELPQRTELDVTPTRVLTTSENGSLNRDSQYT